MNDGVETAALRANTKNAPNDFNQGFQYVCLFVSIHARDRTTQHGRAYSISKSFVTRRRAADSAVARQGEVDKVTDDLEMELRLSRA
ncbi:hypothetical protein AGMMS50256_05330 [Betaproteobacteria bacterium]|nr:hypothetical protein AGMMS50256_05330 [Betaproteobacteria bacterium]